VKIQIIEDLLQIFYPKLCLICEYQLFENEVFACTICRHDLPVLFFKDATNNEISRKFYGRIPLEETNTLLSFSKEGKTKKLIHELKYNGNENIGTFLGNLDWRTSHRKQTIYRSRFYCTCSITS